MCWVERTVATVDLVFLSLGALYLPGPIIGKEPETDDQRDNEQAHPEFIDVRGDNFEEFLGVDEAVDPGLAKPVQQGQTEPHKAEFMSVHAPLAHSGIRRLAAP